MLRLKYDKLFRVSDIPAGSVYQITGCSIYFMRLRDTRATTTKVVILTGEEAGGITTHYLSDKAIPRGRFEEVTDDL